MGESGARESDALESDALESVVGESDAGKSVVGGNDDWGNEVLKITSPPFQAPAAAQLLILSSTPTLLL